MTIVIVDTSIFLNILGVPGKAQDREKVRSVLEKLVDERAELLLPMVALVEAGNHIAQLKNGDDRRRFMKELVNITRQALRGEASWVLVPYPDPAELEDSLHRLPDDATRGLGFADASIVAVWERQRRRWPTRRVAIWSVDSHLSAYDHLP